VCSDVHCQAYNGVATEHKNTTEAVDATAGEILVDSKGTLNAFFFACCGGRTRNVEDAWGNKSSECLKSIADYEEEKMNSEFKEFPLSPSQLDRWLKMPPSAYCEADDQFRWFKALDEMPEDYKITKRDINGFIKEVRSNNKTITGDRIRSSIPGLRSNLFLVEGNFIYGGGWGHGVGMCQEGAAGMAARGFSYKEILEHYYAGSVIKKVY
jgi:SpoIID/LytB domain protein